MAASTVSTSTSTLGGFADHFSAAVSTYRSFRPSYPAELFAHVSSLCASHDLCVDAGTGNGQAAQSISKYFQKVMAFDPAETMVKNAIKDASNVEYFVSRGEEFADRLGLKAESVDLVISATAVHWMNLTQFYANVHRVLKPGGLLVVFTYDLFSIPSNASATSIIHDFHFNDLADSWPKEISLTVGHYKKLPFPAAYVADFSSHFHQTFPFDVNSQFRIHRSVTLAHTLGYLQSWSGTQRWMAKQGNDKFTPIAEALKKVWTKPEESEEHILYMKLGRKPTGMDLKEKLELIPPVVPLADDEFHKAAAIVLSDIKQAQAEAVAH